MNETFKNSSWNPPKWTPLLLGAHAELDCRTGISTEAIIAACLDSTEHSSSILKFISDTIQIVMGESFQFTINLEECCVSGVLAKKVSIMMDSIDSWEINWSFPDPENVRKLLLNSKCFDNTLDAMSDLNAARNRVHGYDTSAIQSPMLFVKILCTFLSMECLGITTVSCSPIPLWNNNGENGPAASPMTVHLLIGLPTIPSCGFVEPEGVAILRVMTGISRGRAMTSPPKFLPSFVGTGTDGSGTVCCCLVTGTSVIVSPQEIARNSSWTLDTLTLLETNLDDITSEALSFSIQALLEIGAVDAWVTPIVMKKGRPAHTLSCLCISSEVLMNQILAVIFRQTTTLGVRIYRNIERAALRRKFIQIQTPYGDYECQGVVDVKVGYLNNEVVSVKPEFDHCRAISVISGVPLKRVSDFVTAEAYKQLDHNFEPCEH